MLKQPKVYFCRHIYFSEQNIMVRTIRRRKALGKRRAGRGKRVGKARGRRVLNANRQDKATVIETQELTAVPEGGNFIGHQLGQYNRAVSVSRNYRFYRCKKVEIEFIPYANVFASGSAFPELYFQVDRTQGLGLPGATLPLPTKNMMMARGVMPLKWTSVIRKSYIPSVLRAENFIQNVEPGGNVSSIASITSTPVMNKWYATQNNWAPPTPGTAAGVVGMYSPTSLRYFGATYFINQDLAPPSAILGTIKMRVHWEFKEPLWLTDSTDPAPAVSTS